MDLGLAGKVALVTGGSRGIGAAIVRGLAAAGCDVAFNHLGDAAAAAGVLADVEALGRRGLVVEGDVADPAAMDSLFDRVEEELGPLWALVCNAGITRDGVIWKMDEAAWDAVLAVNLTGTFLANRAAARRFRGHAGDAGGRIVNIASINGLRGKFGQSNYAASKGGIIAMTKSIARELGRKGVTVNAVAPGMVLTEMAKALPPEFVQKAADESVLGRIAEPEDIADAVVFLCSERARHVTGCCIKVDGGQYI